MIAQSLVRRILGETQEFWNEEVKKQYFKEIARGKEIGHRIADLVDEKTTALLIKSADYVTRRQCDDGGRERPRSMGDIWVESNGIFHPVNVKTGVSETGGQPNMASLKKILGALLALQIDSYYLLVVKLKVGKKLSSSVYFVDMLDYLDYFTFDSGPGQIMMKADAFFAAVSGAGAPAKLTIPERVDRLMEMYEDGERRLAANRRRTLQEFHRRVETFKQLRDYAVTKETQASLNLQ